jgi:hypothetical protein
MTGRFFAEVNPGDILLDLQKPGPPNTGVAYMVGAVCLMVLLVVLWAAFIRKPKDERARYYRDGSSNSSSAGQRTSNSSNGSENGERKRRRRRRPRNPTLAETGGLPPRRDEAPAGDPP